MFLDEWNWDAGQVNKKLRHLADCVSWIILTVVNTLLKYDDDDDDDFSNMLF
jgi:hypothetical protein